MIRKKIKFSNHVAIYLTILLFAILLYSGVFRSVPHFTPDKGYWASWKKLSYLNQSASAGISLTHKKNKKASLPDDRFSGWSQSVHKNFATLHRKIYQFLNKYWPI